LPLYKAKDMGELDVVTNRALYGDSPYVFLNPIKF